MFGKCCLVILISLFLLVLSEDTPFLFRDVTLEAGIDLIPHDKVTGPSIVDLNQDGFPDILQTNHVRDPPDVYYGNANGTFTRQERFLTPGDRHGTCVGDLDNNGMPDAVVSVGAVRRLSPPTHVRVELTNLDGTFNTTNKSQTGFVQRAAYLFGCRLMDMDGDGDLDMLGQGGLNKRRNNFLFKNLGGSYFKLLWKPIGSEMFRPFALGYLVTDFNADGYLDIILYGDRIELWKGGRNFGFKNVTFEVFPSDYRGRSFSSAAQIDIDNDGDFDLYFAGGKRLKGPGKGGRDLLLENRGGIFFDISRDANIPTVGGRIGVGVADFDNDGYLDLFLGSSIPEIPDRNATRMVDIMLRNNGNNTFTTFLNHGATEEDRTGDVTFPAGLQPFDYNQDGLVDVVVGTRLNYNSRDGPGTVFGGLYGKLQLFKNIVNNTNNWFVVDVPVNVNGRTTMDALLKLKTSQGWLYRRVGSVGEGRSHSFITQVHFGIGSSQEVEEVVLQLIGGSIEISQNLTGVPVNQIYSL